jgi:23S rRNA (adenine1618-N6)-methyltransferase
MEKQEKLFLHARNQHRFNYDFELLTKACAELSSFVFLNDFGNQTIDFSNPEAVKTLNKSLLAHFYHIKYWDIPEGYLCPPIPGRADYIHYAADLLASSNQQFIPKGKKIKVLDVGVGANCVYPMIGHQEYGWSFIGSDIDELAVKAAKNIINVNAPLKNQIEIRFQQSKNQIFKGIVHSNELFDLTICNPPFHASAQEALESSQRKNRNLGNKKHIASSLNFGGKNNELWTNGGEIAFITKMIEESKLVKNQCFWFSTLVSKSENLDSIYAMLKRQGVIETRTANMQTGNKITRIVAWTFLDANAQKNWIDKRFV